MDAFAVAQQLYRAAKRMTHAKTVLTGRRESTLEGTSYHIQIDADDGKRYAVAIREMKVAE